jgi:fluoroquinolone transport system permease protein
MNETLPVLATLTLDARRLARDRFLLGAAGYLVVCAVALRWLAPWLHSELLESTGVDIAPYFALGASYFIVVNASVLTGMIGGFLVIEAREEGVFAALRVAPPPPMLPLVTLLGVVLVSGILLTLVQAGLVGVGVPTWPATVAAAVVGAPMGVIMTLLFATLATNKVEAFAVMKVTSLLGLAPVAAYFLPEPAQYVAGVVPAYWACRIWWVAAAGGLDWGWMVVPALVSAAAWILVLLRRFRVALER